MAVARECGGLYYFDDGYNVNRQAQFSSSKSLSVKNIYDVMLWHFRLGHPSFQYMNICFQSCFLINIVPYFFVKHVN